MGEKKKAKTTKPSKKAKPKKKTVKQKAAKDKVQIAEKQLPVADAVVVPSDEQAVAAVAALPVAEVVVKKKKKVRPPKGTKYYGTGRRKEAIAKVWIHSGSGNISVNGKNFSEYFCNRKLLEFRVKRPLVTANVLQNFDVIAQAFGGGVPAQAGAVSLGIARALLQFNPEFRVQLKREGLLRRDPRMKERKKYGLKRARKAFQYTKR